MALKLLLKLVCYAAICWWLYGCCRRIFAPARPKRPPANPPKIPEPLDAAYRRLGIRHDCSADELRRAYRRLAMQYHPDRLKNEPLSERRRAEATREMAEINEAWRVIRTFRKV